MLRMSLCRKGLANDEKRPCIRNNVQRPRDRAVAFAPDKACNLCPLRRDGHGGRPSWVILAVAERAIYDCTRRAGSLAAPQRNVMVMLSPFAVWGVDINAASSYTTRIDLRKK